jgi:hypothetical protein
MLATLLKAFGFDGDDPRVCRDYEIKEEKAPTGLILPKLNRRMFMAGAVATAAVAALPTLPEFPRRAYSFPAQIRRKIAGIRVDRFIARNDLIDVSSGNSLWRELMPSGHSTVEFSTEEGQGLFNMWAENSHYPHPVDMQVVLAPDKVARFTAIFTRADTSFGLQAGSIRNSFEMAVIGPIEMNDRPSPDRTTLLADQAHITRYSHRYPLS